MTVKINLATGEITDNTEDKNNAYMKEWTERTGFSKFFDEMEKEIVSGQFAEGHMVTVRIDGKEYTRRVRNSAKKYADLYIMVKGYAFTYSDFWKGE